MEKQLYADLETGDYKLEYYLLENDDNSGYGIQVNKVSNQIVAETNSVYDVSIKKDETCNFIEKIKDGAVTPISLKEVVEDWISE